MSLGGGKGEGKGEGGNAILFGVRIVLFSRVHFRLKGLWDLLFSF